MGPSAACIFCYYALFYINFYFSFLAMPLGMQDLSFPVIKPVLPAVETWSLNHWTSREVPHAASFDGPRYPIPLDMVMCWGAQLSRYRVGYYVEIFRNCSKASQCGCPRGHSQAHSTGQLTGCPMSSRAPFTGETQGLGPAWAWGWPQTAWIPWSLAFLEKILE